MRVFLLFVLFSFSNVFLYSADVTEDRPISIPVFSPDSDRFFGNEFQWAFSKTDAFWFFNAYGDLFEVPKEAKPPSAGTSLSRTAVRFAGATGAMYPIHDHFSLMGGIGFVMEDVYMADSTNFYAGVGLFAHREFWDINFGLGILGGYYRDHHRKIPVSDDGFYRGVLVDQETTVTNAARFMIVPRLGLSDRIFFLDELAANFGVSENIDGFSLLSRLAFKVLQIGAARLGINVYYDIYRYNLLLDQRLFGATFDTRFLSVNFGYRWFDNISGESFANNFRDGIYGRFIAKIPLANVPILLSYAFEHTFEVRHFFGIGVSFSAGSVISNLHYEISGIDNWRFISSNLIAFER